MTRYRLHALAALALAVMAVALLPAGALAAPASWKSVDMTLIQGSSGQPVLLVSGTLPESASLPAEVSLAVPTGSTVGWAGEILGGDAANDPEVKYVVKSQTDYDLVEFTLTKARTGQVEVAVPDAMTSDGTTTHALVDIKSAFDVATVTLNVDVPSGASVTSSTPGASAGSTGGPNTYGLLLNGVKKGQQLQLAVDFTGGTSGSAASGGTSASSSSTAGGTSSSGSSGPASPLLVISVLGLLITATIALLKRVAPTDE